MRELTNKDRASPVNQEHFNLANWQHSQDVYSQIEMAFLLEVGNAEELAKLIEPGMCLRSTITILTEYAAILTEYAGISIFRLYVIYCIQPHYTTV